MLWHSQLEAESCSSRKDNAS